VLHPGAMLSEEGLVREFATLRRRVTIAALEPCEIIHINADDLRGLNPEQALRVRTHALSQVLSQVPFFSSLSFKQRYAVAMIMETAHHERDGVIFEQDDPGDCMYVLLQGVVEMWRASDVIDEEMSCVATYLPNAERPWFGAMSLWTGSPRLATAICVEDVELLVVRSEHFSRFIELIPHFRTILGTSANAFATINEIKAREEQDAIEVKIRQMHRGKAVNEVLSAADSKGGFAHALARTYDPRAQRKCSVIDVEW